MGIELPEDTIRDVKTFLAARGEDTDVEKFVDQSVQRALFFGVVNSVHQRNADEDASKTARLINEAVAASRAADRDSRADRS